MEGEHGAVVVRRPSWDLGEAARRQIRDRRLEEHNVALIDGPDGRVEILVHWSEVFLVAVAWLENEPRVRVRVSAPGLVDELVAEDVRIRRKVLGHGRPERSELGLQPLGVVVEGLERRCNRVREVVLGKVLLEACREQRVPGRRIHGNRRGHGLRERNGGPRRIDGPVGHALAAIEPRKHVLVCVQKHSDSVRSEAVDDPFHHRQIACVEFAARNRDAGPHHAEAHRGETPAGKRSTVLVRERVLCRVGLHIRVPRRDLVNRVHAVKNARPVVLVDDELGLGVHCEKLRRGASRKAEQQSKSRNGARHVSQGKGAK
eukprot:Amastigsp_a175061_33.p2 type:complete len:317 gc:universal Amastigsp_a175061_33:639-1589(+)